jgi:hypothetical protein
MKASKVLILTAAVFSLSQISSNALAACVQGDLAGKWKLSFQLFGNSWSECLMTVSTNGNLVAGAPCSYSDGTTTKINSGRLVLNSACNISGTINFSNGTTYTVAPDKGTLGLDKIYFSLLGKTQTGAFIGNGIKR